MSLGFQKCKKSKTCKFCSTKISNPAKSIYSIVISLKEDSKRRENAELELHKTGLCKNGGFWIVERHPKGGIVGCYESHKAVARYAYDQNLKEVLILEDDVKFLQSDFTLVIEKLNQIKTYDKHWMLFYLGWTSPIKLSWNSLQFYKTIGQGIIQGGFETTHSYFMSRPMMNMVGYDGHSINMPIDEYYSRYFYDRSYALYPLYTVQNDTFQSNIQDNNKTEAWNLTSSRLCYTLGLNHGAILLIVAVILILIFVLLIIIIYKRYKKTKSKTKRWNHG